VWEVVVGSMNRFVGLLRLAVLVVVAGAVSGCASIMNGSTQTVFLDSRPRGATVMVNEMPRGKTPVTVDLPRNRDQIAKFQLDGCEDQLVKITSGMSGWFCGNCLFGGPIGMVVDLATGSMYTLSPDKVTITLKCQPGGVSIFKGDNIQMSSGNLTLAVADFTPQDISAGNAAIIAELFRTEIVKAGSFDVVEKANMEKVLSEQAFQQTGCTSSECAVKLGKILNVRYLIVGSFGKLMDSFILNIRMVDVQTAKVVYSDSSQGKDVAAVQSAIREMAGKLSRAVRSGNSPSSTPVPAEPVPAREPQEEAPFM